MKLTFHLFFHTKNFIQNFGKLKLLLLHRFLTLLIFFLYFLIFFDLNAYLFMKYDYFFISAPKIQFRNLIFLFIILQLAQNYLFLYILLIVQTLLDNDLYKINRSHPKTYYWIRKSLKKKLNLKVYPSTYNLIWIWLLWH